MHLRRRTLASSAALAVTVATVVLTTGGQAPALADGLTRTSGGPAAAGTRTVTAGPASFAVPSSWAVDDPAGCVRLNRHAIYVGHQDPTATCPASAVGRTEALQVEPLDAAVSPAADVPSMTSSALAASPSRARDAVAGQYQVVVSDLKILVTGSYGNDPGTIEQVLASIRPAAHPQAWPTVSASAVKSEYASARASAAVNAARAPRTMNAQAQSARSASAQAPFNGLGFDACTAPSVGAMSAWLSSWYKSVGIYVGGADRACGDGWLNSSWVNATTAMGWKLIPIYVGLQAPCWPYNGGKINPAYASQQGLQAADDAVYNMQRFGLGPGNPIYFDMEGYSTSDTGCSAAVKSFTISWTSELHAKGYLSGFYSSASTGIADLVKWYGSLSPDDVWFADWNNQAVTTDWVFPTTNYWPNHQRMHQFLGGHNETYGGYTINIDSNRVDSDVVGDPPRSTTITQPPVQTTPLPPATDVFQALSTTRVYDSGADNPLVANTDREVQVTGLGNIPSNADAVVLNVEVQSPTKAGYIRVTPGGYTSQTAVQEFAAGQTLSAVSQVRVGANGKVRLHLSAGTARVLLDAEGYFVPSTGTNSDRYHPVPTTRVYGTNSPRLVAGADQPIQIAGLATVPSTATAVVANVEVYDATAAGYIRVTPTPTGDRSAVQEFVPGVTISNLTTVQLAPDGTIALHLSQGSAAVFVDVVGYYGGTTGDVYHPVPTARAYDKLPVTAGADQDLVLTGRAGVPSLPGAIHSVTMTVEIYAPTQTGYIRVTPGGVDSQTAVQEFTGGQTVSNLVTVQLDSQGRARLHLSNGSAIAFLDVVGYSAAS
jgi:hypothetical protein